MPPWLEEEVRAPATELLESLSVGGQTVDPEECERLSRGVNGCFYAAAPAQYASWPSGSTADGTVVYLITRIDEQTLEVVGITWLDFGAGVFPSRALVTVGERSVRVTGFIGHVDRRTGAPPRLPRSGTLIDTPGDSGVVSPTLIAGHREVQLEWTKAFELSE